MRICKWIIGISAIFSVAAISISCFILCRYAPISSGLNLDYMGVIIGILSLLVTVLLGWNIYSALDLKEEWREYRHRQDELEQFQKDMKKQSLKNENRLCAIIYTSYAEVVFNGKSIVYAVSFSIDAVCLYSTNGDWGIADRQLGFIADQLRVDNRLDDISIEECLGLIQKLGQIGDSSKKLSNYNNLHNLLKNKITASAT